MSGGGTRVKHAARRFPREKKNQFNPDCVRCKVGWGIAADWVTTTSCMSHRKEQQLTHAIFIFLTSC